MGDTSKHLTYFKIENFKRFESFEMNDLGQFNLIVGDNNVGKTSVLEALLFDKDHWTLINNLISALQFKNLKRSFTYQDLELYSNREFSNTKRAPSISFQWTDQQNGEKDNFLEIKFDKTEQQLTFSRKKGVVQLDLPKFNFTSNVSINQNLTLPFIPFYKGHDEDLTNFYSRLQEDRVVKSNFLQSLKILIPQLDNIELSNPYASHIPHLIVYQTHLRTSLPLALFGDGVLKLFRLLAEIIINKKKRLMIDEIDTGIHHSRFKEFWKTILITARDNDVQLFMTTHNEECIKYFVEVFNEPELRNLKNNARNISMIELPNKLIKAYTYSYEQLEANVQSGNEIRGGIR